MLDHLVHLRLCSVLQKQKASPKAGVAVLESLIKECEVKITNMIQNTAGVNVIRVMSKGGRLS